MLTKLTNLNAANRPTKQSEAIYVRSKHLNKLIDELEADGLGVDSMQADTITEKTADAGVTVEDVLIKDGAIAYKESIINANASTLVLTAAQTGSTILLNRAAGCDVTLPSGEVGLVYKFKVITSVTSNDYSITAAAATELFTGGISAVSTATLDKTTQFSPDGTDDDAISMNGGTTGGRIGTTLVFTYVAANKWYVEGVVAGQEVFTTPFQ